MKSSQATAKSTCIEVLSVSLLYVWILMWTRTFGHALPSPLLGTLVFFSLSHPPNLQRCREQVLWYELGWKTNWEKWLGMHSKAQLLNFLRTSDRTGRCFWRIFVYVTIVSKLQHFSALKVGWWFVVKYARDVAPCLFCWVSRTVDGSEIQPTTGWMYETL